MAWLKSAVNILVRQNAYKAFRMFPLFAKPGKEVEATQLGGLVNHSCVVSQVAAGPTNRSMECKVIRRIAVDQVCF